MVLSEFEGILRDYNGFRLYIKEMHEVMRILAVFSLVYEQIFIL